MAVSSKKYSRLPAYPSTRVLNQRPPRSTAGVPSDSDWWLSHTLTVPHIFLQLPRYQLQLVESFIFHSRFRKVRRNRNPTCVRVRSDLHHIAFLSPAVTETSNTRQASSFARVPYIFNRLNNLEEWRSGGGHHMATPCSLCGDSCALGILCEQRTRTNAMQSRSKGTKPVRCTDPAT